MVKKSISSALRAMNTTPDKKLSKLTKKIENSLFSGYYLEKLRFFIKIIPIEFQTRRVGKCETKNVNFLIIDSKSVNLSRILSFKLT
uniref:Ribosomal protein L22 n=1 Tax=Romanomermis culicivorax TaxID=13658 RepID=A0A915L903_ROMCU